MNTAPCGRTRLRYGHRYVARLLLLISVAAGMKAVVDVPSRYRTRSMVWLRFRNGAEVLVDSSDGHFYTQLVWQLTRRARDLEVSPVAISFTALVRAILRMAI